MIILRGTQKFLSFSGRHPAPEPASGPSSLQWYVNVFYVDRKKCLIFTHADTLFSFLVVKVSKRNLAGDLLEIFRKELSRAMFHLKCRGITRTNSPMYGKASPARWLGWKKGRREISEPAVTPDVAVGHLYKC